MRCNLVLRLAFCALFALVLSFSTTSIARAQAWSARYNGTGNGNDVATTVVVDASGNVYVTGSSVGSGLNPGTTDVITRKYSSSGALLWSKFYDGIGKHDDGGTAIAVDSAGNVYVAGYATGVGSGKDLLLVKYDSAGVEQWARRKPGAGGGDDTYWGLALDSAGNPIAIGAFCFSAAGDTDLYTIKYNASGTEQWAARVNSGVGDSAFGIAIDASDNVHVTGRTGSLGTYNYRTLKYNSAGTQQWIISYNGPGAADDEAYAIALDGSGNVYVTGYSTGSGTGTDYATIKYSSSGAQLWAARYNGTAGASDEGRGVAVDSSGNVYVTGASMDTGSTSGFATLKYSSGGAQQWVHREDTGLGMDGARKLFMHSGGDVYVVGDLTVAGQFANSAYFRYDYTGLEMQSGAYNNTVNDRGYSVAVVASNKAIHIAGPSDGVGSGTDYATSKFNHVKLDTTLVADDTAGAATQTKALSALLTRNADGMGLPGRTVNFTISGVSVGSTVTDAHGRANLPYLIPGGTPLGTYPVVATFAGDVDYNASNDGADLHVRKMSVLTVYDRSGTITFPVTLRALLKVDNLVYPNATVRFLIDGVEVGTGVTGSNGAATYVHTITEAVGNHVVTAEFDGDTTAAPATSPNGNLLVKLITTSISMSNYTMAPGKTVNIKATLTGGGGPLAGRTISFKLDGVFFGNRVTDANGLATLSYVVDASLGDHTITADFAGEAGMYAASTKVSTLTVRANTRTVPDRFTAAAGSSVTFGATLKRTDTNTALEGRTVSFYDTATMTLLGTGVTDVNGRAEITTTAPAAGVKQLIQAQFGGEATFRESVGNGYIFGT